MADFEIIAAGQQTLPPSLEGPWYTDQAVFDAEQRLFFSRRWVCVARSDELPEPGRFLTATVAGESLIVLRGEDGAARAFYNVCRHRGARLIREDCGVAGRVIRCPYHSWAYDWDGELRAAPNMREAGREQWAELGLRPVALGEQYGCVFVNLAGDDVSLDDDIGRQVRARMGSDELMATWQLESLATGRRRVYEVAANWKLIVENFSECYHCPGVHPELVSVLPEFKLHRGTLQTVGYGAAYGEGIGGFTIDGRAGLPPLPGLAAEDARRYYGLVLTPNLFLNLVGDHVILHRLEPLAPDRTRVVCHWLFDPAVLAAGLDIEPSVELFHRTNCQDFDVCERCQDGVGSRSFVDGGVLVPVELQLQGFHEEMRAALGDTAPGRSVR